MDKTALKNFAVRARKKLIAEVTQKAYEAGVTRDKPHDIGIETYDGGFKIKGRENGKVFKKHEIKQRAKLLQRISENGFDQVMEEIAYTWFNRFIALRFMEINNYLPTEVRVLSSLQPGKKEPDIIQEALNIDLKLDKNTVFQLQDSGDQEELYKYLLIRQCNQLGEIMPAVFEKIEDYTELLLPNNLLAEGSVILDLVESIEEYDWKVELDGDKELLKEEKGEHGIEIIGWLYQYYNSEKKDEVFAALKKNIKITKENIPAATQLFTPAWIVKYMVENSLGRLWLENKTVGSGQLTADMKKLKAKWKYYLDEAEQEPEVQKQLEELRDPNLSPEEIKILDPAMGSGHILVYAFDVLYDIYLSAGYSERQIPALILEKNLYGLDIDDRAGQLASFALLMKARSKNRRIFDQEIELNLCSIQESVGSGQFAVGSGQLTVGSNGTVSHEELIVDNEELVNYFVQGFSEGEAAEVRKDLEYLLDVFHDAKEYGSILEVKETDFAALENRIEYLRVNILEDELGLKYRGIILEKVLPLIKQGKIMSQKYDVVCSNPPYMGRRNMNPKLAKFLNDKFPDSKNDLFATFIEKGFSLVNKNGFNAMVTMQSWMFLSSYEKMRKNILKNYYISALVHMENMVMGIAFGTSATIFRNSIITDYTGTYFLVGLGDINKENNELMEFPVRGKRFSNKKTNVFSKIPGSPIAYWISDKVLRLYGVNKFVSNFGRPCKGIDTGNNDKFLRLWFEVNHRLIHLNFTSMPTPCTWENYRINWVVYNKGGQFRKWYGNNDYIIYWKNNGQKLKKYKGSNLRNKKYYFMPGITWSTVTSGKLSVRKFGFGHLFDNGGSCFFSLKKKDLDYVLALLNSVIMRHLSDMFPTLNFQPGNIGKIPIIIPKAIIKVNKILQYTRTNVLISRIDWDFFEASWDFKSHPLLLAARGQLPTSHSSTPTGNNQLSTANCPLPTINSLSTAFKIWSDYAESQFNQLKANEEELNRIFIDIYGLQDELTPEVEDKDVTVRKADRERDIKSFISYAVGCMFGRYSLHKEGLIYAGGAFNKKYRLSNGVWEINTGADWVQSAIDIAQHAIIPIADGDYFEDDILERFIEFLKVVFGKDTLEENLDYIAETLGVRANETSRQAIRRYFLSGFYKDHVQIYKKRPIYWLFNSGRRNGFKALIYMHRYDSHTVARVRIDYLHELQRKYEAEIKLLDVLIDSNISNREKAVSRKKREKIEKQIEECRRYDQAIKHVAEQQIGIDLDDGVKVNHAKFQGIKIPIKGKLLKTDLLARI